MMAGVMDGLIASLLLMAVVLKWLALVGVVIVLPVVLLLRVFARWWARWRARWRRRRAVAPQTPLAVCVRFIGRHLLYLLFVLGPFVFLYQMMGWEIIVRSVAVFVLIAIVFGPPLWWFERWRERKQARLAWARHLHAPARTATDLLMIDPWLAWAPDSVTPPHRPGARPAALLAHLCRPDAAALDPDQAAYLRPVVLHGLGLRLDLSDADLARQVPQVLRARWFCLDVQDPGKDSNPRALLAFACLRVVLTLRAARLLGWLDAALYDTLVRLNTQRVRDCFADWPTFVDAYTLGRSQWCARGRTDVLGETLNPEALRADLGWNGAHPPAVLAQC